MPFVVIEADIDSNLEPRKEEIEQACKAAWISMNGVEGASGLKESDVGGVMSVGRPNPCSNLSRVLFFYVDRGTSFREQLGKRLVEKVLVAPYYPREIKLIPTKPGLWFADPVWSQAPCTRSHSGQGSEHFE